MGEVIERLTCSIAKVISQDVYKRQELSHLGTIAVLYTNPTDKENPGLTGGIVLEDGHAYSFVYAEDILTYEEEQA